MEFVKKIMLIRHASPDWERKDIPYDIPPGPPLSAKGEKEAEQLAEFLKAQEVVKLYHSPFERTSKTAQIVSAINDIHSVEEPRLAEWRGRVEAETSAKERMKATFDHAVEEAKEIGSIGLVSHGGPIDVLLQELGMDMNKLAVYKTKFDTTNPMPPAGVWAVAWSEKNNSWNLELKFMPSVT
jgi:broad specificity phosphatase PhoE